MPQLVFLTFLLGLTTGQATVSLQADPAIASIRLELDGHAAATIDDAPWTASVDFGSELIPQRLIAIGYDASGHEIARTSQDVNLPRAAAEVEILVKNEGGRPARAELVARNRKHSKPASAKLTLDGDTVPIGSDFVAKLPSVEWQQPHVLSAELQFEDGEIARREIAVSGGLGQTVSSDLTPVLVTNLRRSEPDKLDGCFSVDGAPLRVNALERSNALVIVVKDPSGNLLPTARTPGGWSPGPLQRELELDPDTSQRILWATPQQFAAHDEPTYSLFQPSIDFSATKFGMLWILTRLLKPAPDGPRRLADAVGVAGLAAYQSGRRRAVVLLLDEAPDLSLISPAVIRRYLERLGVPLFVWSIGKVPPRGWGNVVDISTRYKVATAVAALKDTLNRQRIAWIPSDPLASLRVEVNERCGLKPVALPVTKPDASRRPAS
jgi:hypothetical protein